MAVALDVSKIFKFCFQILKANRILFRQYLNRFSKFSSPDAVQRAKTVKIIFFENGAPFCNYDVIKKIFFGKCSFTSWQPTVKISKSYLFWLKKYLTL